jgi:CRISPR-associated protein Cas1
MDLPASSDLKSILHSKRVNIYYLQHCRVLVNGGRVEYVTDEGRQSRYWNIPISANAMTFTTGHEANRYSTLGTSTWRDSW